MMLTVGATVDRRLVQGDDAAPALCAPTQSPTPVFDWLPLIGTICTGNATVRSLLMLAEMLLNDEPGGRFQPLSLTSRLVLACNSTSGCTRADAIVIGGSETAAQHGWPGQATGIGYLRMTGDPSDDDIRIVATGKARANRWIRSACAS
ncbi:MAG: hypothetical protein R3F08_09600 [Dokdonella sp.]